ncbi:MAG: GNAT family N-acetyltransferase [Deltaproteobacteria bacterium]|nr:GNAT family N-acetyltransferase [Deltaproteobacteria bacterium]
MEDFPDSSELIGDYPKEILLKDGTGLTLRPIQPEDAAPLFEMFARLPEEDKWYLDGDFEDPMRMEKWVLDRDPRKQVSIVASLEGKVVSLACLSRKHFGSKSHIGEIRISVDPSFRARHLGTWMLMDLMNLAISMELEILVMHLVEDRDALVIGGARKLGFSPEAVLRNYIRDRQGNPHNFVILVKRLYRGWEDE